ncbi:nuclear transport factor 2 family protein [Amycolatopsis jejuensis]|uniref:nuclear transport factor 2 family protein n=1 Tax=Amycolatopsis jejuensis TaxID=330084 RepID=UPI0005266E34|nr:nuclear transport factor 2 family protein [Amycolatopsis jejuensis]
MTTQLTRRSTAGTFFDALATQDFARLASTMDPDVKLTALLPPGLREFHGTDEITATFTRWFGDTDEFELAETDAGRIGPRVHLRWRVRMRAARLGTGRFTVEQQVYADEGEDGRFSRLVLLCSGYCPES